MRSGGSRGRLPGSIPALPPASWTSGKSLNLSALSLFIGTMEAIILTQRMLRSKIYDRGSSWAGDPVVCKAEVLVWAF